MEDIQRLGRESIKFSNEKHLLRKDAIPRGGFHVVLARSLIYSSIFSMALWVLIAHTIAALIFLIVSVITIYVVPERLTRGRSSLSRAAKCLFILRFVLARKVSRLTKMLRLSVTQPSKMRTR